MSVFTIGRICVKLAGRDAGKKCVVLSEEKDGKVLIDGATRRREVSLKHLEPINETVSIAANAATKEVASVLKEMGVTVRETKAKKAVARPKHLKKVKKGGKSKPAAKAKVVKEAKKVKAPEAKKAEAKVTKAPEAKAEAKKFGVTSFN